MDAILTRDQILSVDDLKKERVSVPEWGGDVFVRSLTGTERDRFEDHCSKAQGKSCEGIMALLVALTVVDEHGQRLFTEADIAALGQKSARALGILYETAGRLNAISGKDVEDLAKN